MLSRYLRDFRHLARQRLARACCLIVALSSSIIPAARSKPHPISGDISYDATVKPLLEKYCYSCHGEKKHKADLSLHAFEKLTASDLRTNQFIWEKVLNNVQNREMPPREKPQPSEVEREIISRWIEKEVFACDCNHPDPGRVTLRRLNRAEYNNTIRDLLGVEFQPARGFPADDTGYGFDNNGDVLSLSPILLEKYFAAADRILSTAILTDAATNGSVQRFDAAKLESTAPGGAFAKSSYQLTREGEIYATHAFPQAGEYIFRVKAFGQQAGPDPARMNLLLDGVILKTFDVTAIQSSPATYEILFKTGSGPKRISAAYINNYVNRDDPDPENRDRNLVIDYLEIAGPKGPPIYPESHKIILSKPIPVRTEARRIYAREIIGKFARRAYRRPLARNELDQLTEFFEMAQTDGESFESGIRLAFQAVLVSPHFLFRGELQADPDNRRSSHAIDEFALASRLSYFLWSSMPDEELFRLAKRGQLRKNLEGQVRRMLRDKKSSALVENFVGQWLQIRNLNLVAPDPEKFPAFDEPLRLAMRKETELFFQSLLKGNRSVLEILGADYTFVNGSLARLYGLPKISGDKFQRVSLKGTSRSGILTHASILTLTSNPNRTSPVKRGKWVLENILGTPPPPPPPNVPDLKEKGVAVTGTLRQRIEQHRSDPNCASCHARMDPLGFAFENFDGIGAWRKQDGGSEIDSSGELVSGESFTDSTELRKILMTTKKKEFVRCLTEKMLTYALGRGMEMYDRCAINDISNRIEKHDYKFAELIVEVARSVPFQMRRGEEHVAQVPR